MFSALARFVARMASLFRNQQMDAELNDEFQAHLDMLTDDKVRSGIPYEEARRLARLELGSLAKLREEHREVRSFAFIDGLFRDLKFTCKILRRDAGFAIFATLIVGLGIGASTIIFSVVDALIIKPLPFKDPARLVWIANKYSVPEQTTQVNYVLDQQRESKSFEDIGAYFFYYQVGNARLTSDGEPERITNVPVTETFFSVLGVKPLIGRFFSPEDSAQDAPPVTVLSNAIWRRRFGSDPNIVGRTVTLDDAQVRVIGVLPNSFDFASVFTPGSHADCFSPFPLNDQTNRWGNTLSLVGRLRDGATVKSAQAELDSLTPHFREENPRANDFSPLVLSLKDHVTGKLHTALIVLAFAVGALMLIVCANLSNLLLARNSARRTEMAIRVALGAGRGHLVRQLLTESLVLSLAGSVFGTVIAFVGTRIVAHLDAFSIPLLSSVTVDGFALFFALVAAIATGLAFGLVPALQIPSTGVSETLKENGRGATGGARTAWVRGTLVIMEIAFACVLLITAGLLIRSLVHVLDLDPGFRPEMAAVMRIDPGQQYNSQQKFNLYIGQVLERVRNTPGITEAGITDVLPLEGDRSWGVEGVGQNFPPNEFPTAFVRIVSEGYFKSMGVPMVAGRDFVEDDTPSTEPVIIVNQALARKLWPGEEALDKHVTVGNCRVVGVVGNVRHIALEQESGLEMYLPIRQNRDHMSVNLIVRTSLPPTGLAATIREALKPIDPNIPVNEFRTIQMLVDRASSSRRFVVTLLSGFSAFALILASLGIYAVISYSVSQRTQEIGLRMALGATSGKLQFTIMMQTLRLAVIGLMVGIVVSWFITRVIEGLLFGVSATDPFTFLSSAIVLGLIAALAGYVPARRASRIDPMTALRAN